VGEADAKTQSECLWLTKKGFLQCQLVIFICLKH